MITGVYWAFMLTDGALRMLILLHFHILGFSPIQLAYLFLLYELAGVITNLLAGWIASRLGLMFTLYLGISLQIIALIALFNLDSSWDLRFSALYASIIQGISGIAKDLTKMSSKSAVKVFAPDENNSLFKWVAFLTGSKNMIKGLGYFLGAALLGTIGFKGTILGMGILLMMIFTSLLIDRPIEPILTSKKAKFKELFSRSRNVNTLSCARMFLFGARDIWFVVGIPIYFYSILSDGSAQENRAAFFIIGSFMASWIMLYGAIQIVAPRILKAKQISLHQLTHKARKWALILALIPLTLTTLALLLPQQNLWFASFLTFGLLLFGIIFAINSSLHSYLILAFTQNTRVTLDVGFYYMSNAAGRLFGTLLSGLLYQFGGLSLILCGATIALFISAICLKFDTPPH